MVGIGTILFTLIARLLLIIFLIFLAPFLLICLLFPQKLLVDNWFFKIVSRLFYWFCVRCSFLPISYHGLENIGHEPAIIICNHQSSFDIPLIGYALGNRTHLWLAWAALAKSALLRFILPRNSILVDMSSPVQGMRTIVQAIQVVKTNPWDLIIFPEGGRYTDGQVHEFFGGFALIAKKINRPVIPIKIMGVNQVYPPHTFWIYYHPITVIIGKPFHIIPDETEEAFKQRIYQWYLQDSNGNES